ncbi:Wzz/FepE/Etk N-terminal domain-containing protein [Psychromarinibacter sp. C21-152]|uniref:non-specific protein-tyrosine kinase n=1 Tax=Psychromarinibacter sediminicola TaxID=3033385 RepID=A0AAE3NVT5_9RHOB|nr:Wzz/FepE/Etk N-terminal domain-containing protein [Psychromarinibacter sediminicola]MDF0601562.1 Wzz/FepE/Etk N-terminal domain-containing protein [Psychromarinibacter sediminicola]
MSPEERQCQRKQVLTEITSSPVVRFPHAREEAPVPAADDEIDLLELFGALWRGKWVIALFAILAVAAGGYYAFGVAEPQYSATSRLVLEARDQQVVDVESVVSGVSTDAPALNTELSIMVARPLIEELVRDLDLLEDPEFNPSLTEPSAFSPSTVISLAKSWLGMDAAEEAPPTDRQIFDKTVENVSAAITASNERESYIFSLRATTGDPEKSANMVNRLAQIYLDDQIETKFAATEYAVDWLSERVSELEHELKEQEDAILDLQSSGAFETQAGLQALKLQERDLEERMTELRETAEAASARAAQLEEFRETGEFEAAAALAGDATLQGALDAAVAGEPAAFRARLDTLIEDARERADAAEQQLTSLEPRHDDLLAQIEEREGQRQELSQLMRDADATRVLYETFLTRLKETSIQIGLQQADSRMLASALPGKQVAPRTSMILALALVLGLMLGAAVILLRQFLNKGFRTAEDLEQATAHTVVGQVPRIPIRRRAALIDYLDKNPTSAAAEAIRNLRTSLLMSNVDRPPKVILSTSSIPGEGKTTLAIALAHNLAGLGKNVLLVEGDIRRRTLYQYFRGKPPGTLVQVVSGTLTLAEAVLHDSRLGADVLLGEKSSINAGDLFSSQRFHDFLESARAAYDYVIIDAPPSLVVPDARIMGGEADAILYTVKWDETAAAQVKAGLREFGSVGLRVTGTVLSQIDPKGMKKYGYGGKYGAYGSYGKDYYDVR